MPSLLPRGYADNLRVGQPIGTLGYPGSFQSETTQIVLPTFKDGTLSALRPFYLDPYGDTPEPEQLVESLGMVLHYNFLTEGGTSGSPVFDHYGFIVGTNHAGKVLPIVDDRGDEDYILAWVDTSHNFGISVKAMWQLIDQVGEAPAVAARVAVQDDVYEPFPRDWDGTTIAP